MHISFSIDDDILLALRERAPEFTRDLRFFAALTWYRKGRLSLGKAAELAGDANHLTGLCPATEPSREAVRQHRDR